MVAGSTQTVGTTQMDRALGALIGLAVGDALGTTLEFSRRDQHPPVTDIVGGGPFRLTPGQWTDDTSMALALGDSLLHAGRLDRRDLMDRYVAWWLEGENSCTGECFDIGSTVKASLSYYRSSGRTDAGSTSPDTAGNGSIMRLAPAVLHGIRSLRTTVAVSREQSLVTHAAPACLDACEAMARIMRALILRGEREAPRYVVEGWRPADAGVAAAVDGSRHAQERDAVVSSGFVTATLDAALWSVARTSSFEEALVLAVNLGGDADTVGAVAGQIAGASYGMSGMPRRWLDVLAWRPHIEDMGRKLVERAPADRGILGRLLGR